MTSSCPEVASHGSYGRSLSSSAHKTAPIVFVVANDDHVHRPLEQLIKTAGFDVEVCGSAESFLSMPRPTVPCCLLLDVSSLGGNGLDVQRQVGARIDVPVVFITGRPDVRVTVQAMRAGAVDVLAEPVNPEQLLSAVETALDVSRAALLRDAALRSLRNRFASLTPREREVMGLVVSGLLNKQVAFELSISEMTVKAHRGKVMRKMNADSLPQLVRMAGHLTGTRPESTTEFV